MRSKAVWALVALNVCLLACLVGQWLRPNWASAQAGGAGAAARPSDYILVPGTVQTSPAQVLYMIDTQAGLLSARIFTGQQMVDMGAPIDLNRLFNPRGGGAAPNRRGGAVR
jgi:hypothetical protein